MSIGYPRQTILKSGVMLLALTVTSPLSKGYAQSHGDAEQWQNYPTAWQLDAPKTKATPTWGRAPDHFRRQPAEYQSRMPNQSAPFQATPQWTTPTNTPPYTGQSSSDRSWRYNPKWGDAISPSSNVNQPDPVRARPWSAQQPISDNESAYNSGTIPAYDTRRQATYGSDRPPPYSVHSQPAYDAERVPSYTDRVPPYVTHRAPVYRADMPPAYSYDRAPTYGSTVQPAYNGSGIPPLYRSARPPAYDIHRDQDQVSPYGPAASWQDGPKPRSKWSQQNDQWRRRAFQSAARLPQQEGGSWQNNPTQPWRPPNGNPAYTTPQESRLSPMQTQPQRAWRPSPAPRNWNAPSAVTHYRGRSSHANTPNPAQHSARRSKAPDPMEMMMGMPGQQPFNDTQFERLKQRLGISGETQESAWDALVKAIRAVKAGDSILEAPPVNAAYGELHATLNDHQKKLADDYKDTMVW
ncbi:MAG: hypothetical protein HQL53_09535 [Magnetococcales bacterium]|nr:hypothetical protein [Magnetococcales bacterium]